MSHLLRAPRRQWARAAVVVLILGAGSAAFARQATPALPAAASVGPAAVAPSGTGARGGDIRDIRGPEPLASPWLLPALASAGLLTAAGVYGAWRWAKRRQRTRRKTLTELVLERLQGTRSLMLPERGREFAIEVSNIVREYIEVRFDVRAAHLTTDEFLRNLGDHTASILSANRSLLDDFLQTCDLGKFGGWRLSISDMTTMLGCAREFVLASAESPTPGAAKRDDSASDQPKSQGGRYVSLPTT
jgi:hypothetical protein